MHNSRLWWKDGVIYQVYPRSFADSNGDGIGDLQGVIGKLDYLADLGIDAVWLSPIHPSPDIDFGYDVADYNAIDPRFGTIQDFDCLVLEAHQRGIRVIMDLVLNHTSDKHPWFIESRSSLDNPKRGWYLWRENPNGKQLPPNNWTSVFGGKAWKFDTQTEQWYYHMFYEEQPDLNWRNPQVYQEMMDIFRFWAERGVDGFRLDVFNQYYKDAQFRDNPTRLGIRDFDRQHHIYDTNQPEMRKVISDIRSIVDQYPERYVVGEPFLTSAIDAASSIGPGKLHAAFDFSLLNSPWDPARFLKSIVEQEEVVPDDAWPCDVLNNHDNQRSATRFRDGEKDEKLKIAAAMLLTLRGTPFLYYGEEIGMRNTRVPYREIQDMVAKRFWPVYPSRDGCRSPMQWNANQSAGFTTGKPWQKVHPGYAIRNVEAQRTDPHSLFNFYRTLLQLRRNHFALQEGMFIPLHHDPQRVLAYLRQDSDQVILVALNFARRRSKLALGGEITRHKWEVLLSTKERSQPIFEKGWLKLAGYEVCILVQV